MTDVPDTARPLVGACAAPGVNGLQMDGVGQRRVVCALLFVAPFLRVVRRICPVHGRRTTGTRTRYSLDARAHRYTSFSSFISTAYRCIDNSTVSMSYVRTLCAVYSVYLNGVYQSARGHPATHEPEGEASVLPLGGGAVGVRGLALRSERAGLRAFAELVVARWL